MVSLGDSRWLPHPSAAAHSTIAWLLEDTKFIKTMTLTDGVYAYFLPVQAGQVG